MCQFTLFQTCMPIKSAFLKKPSNLLTKTYYLFFHGTHDLMFSGHMTIALLLRYFVNNLNIDTYVIDYLCILVGCTLVQARQHYTIDVIVSIILFELISRNLYKH